MNLRFYRSLAFFAAILLFTTPPAAAQQVKWAVRHDTSEMAVRNVDPSDVSTATGGVESSEENGPVHAGGSSSASVLQSSDGSVSDDGPGENFDGLGVQDEENIIGTKLAPPDPNVAAGENYVVQMINNIFAVYDKDGSQVMSPKPNNALWDGLGGLCANSDLSDPIVLYDDEAQRWVLSQFARNADRVVDATEFRECVAVSTTTDPTGAYYRYAFEMPKFNDYPKLGVGLKSYTYTHRQFDSAGNVEGPVVGTFERNAMLDGQNARQVLFGPKTGFSNLISLPSEIDGSPPPAGTPNFYAGLDVGGERLRIWKTEIDWSSPSTATFGKVVALNVEGFDAQFCDVIGNPCIPQPDDGLSLTALSDRLMHRLPLRDRGDHLAMVTSHTVDVKDADGRSAGRAGIRWYELRRPDGGSWTVYQQGTYAPTDGENRWMGSMAMAGNGSFGLIYTVTSENTYPSIRYTGRRPNDALGEMTIEEKTVQSGSRSQSGAPTSRWGDYASLVIDPTDDTTFWGTHEYGRSGEPDPGWDTRIFSFDVPAPPLNVGLTGPSYLNSGEQGTWTADVSGGTGSISYS